MPFEIFFEFDGELAKYAEENFAPTGESLDSRSALLALGSYVGSMSGRSRMELFYGLMEWRKRYPEFLAPPDLHLLAANVLMNIWKGEIVELADVRMSPAALLAADRGANFTLPICVSKVRRTLETFIPDNPDGDKRLLLGSNPGRHMSSQEGYFERLQGMRGSVLLCGWDFLGYKSDREKRERLVLSGMIKAAVQLPKPVRQPGNFYPAILLLGEKGDKISLGKIENCGNGPGGLNQAECLACILEKKGTIEADAKALGSTGDYILTQAQPGLMPGGIALRQFADIFRCQISRKKFVGSGSAGETTVGGILARELTMSDLDLRTGITVPGSGTLTELSTRTHFSTYALLRPGDILLTYRGSEASLGTAGLYLDEKGMAVASRSFCVIRAHSYIDPLWLFYNLRREEVAKRIRSYATGNSTLIVSLHAIRDLPMPALDPEKIAKIKEIHADLLEQAKKIASIEEAMSKNMDRMALLIKES